MNINIILDVLLEFLKTNYNSLEQQKISKDSKPYVITLDYSCHFEVLNLNKYSNINRENIISYIEGKSELKTEAILATPDFDTFSNIIYQHRIVTFPNNNIQQVIQLLNILAGLLGYNKLLMIEFTFPRKNIFEIKIFKKKGMLTKKEMIAIIKELVVILMLIKYSLSANRYVFAGADGVIQYYYVNQLPCVCYEFYRCFIDQYIPECKSSFSFELQKLNNDEAERIRSSLESAVREHIEEYIPDCKSSISVVMQGLNCKNVYKMQVNGVEVIRKFFGSETPILVYDYNLYLSVNNFFKAMPSSSKLQSNYKLMYDLSCIDHKIMILFLMSKLHISAELFIQKWRINSQETFLYCVMSAMLLTQVQELKKQELNLYYKAEVDHINIKLKSFVEIYYKERGCHNQASKIKSTQSENAEIILSSNAHLEEDLPALVEIVPDEKSAGKFTSFQEELSAAFNTPAKSSASNSALVSHINSSKTPEMSKALLSSTIDKPFTLLQALTKLCEKQDVDKSHDNTKFRQIIVMEQTEAIALKTQLHSCDECNLSMHRP